MVEFITWNRRNGKVVHDQPELTMQADLKEANAHKLKFPNESYQIEFAKLKLRGEAWEAEPIREELLS